MPMSVATRTVTSNSWPTAISPGPSTVTVGCGGGPGGAAGGAAGGGADGATGCETEGLGPTVGRPGPPPTAPSPAEAGAELLSNPPPPPNGVLRERVSVPYQNSVESEAACACVRMMCGVTDNTISLFSRSVLWDPNSRPTIGIWLRPGIPAALRVSESWIRPARICVSPSFSRKSVLALRVPIVYAWVPPTTTVLVMELTSSPILMDTSPSRYTVC